MEQNNEKDRIMEGTMKEKDRIREELTELLEAYYDDSFAQMACDYIRSTRMMEEEVEVLLRMMKKEKGT